LVPAERNIGGLSGGGWLITGLRAGHSGAMVTHYVSHGLQWTKTQPRHWLSPAECQRTIDFIDFSVADGVPFTG
jgi:hypothetical protein